MAFGDEANWRAELLFAPVLRSPVLDEGRTPELGRLVCLPVRL